MKKNFRLITQAHPHLKENSELEGLAAELDKAQAIAKFNTSEAGKLIKRKTLLACRTLLLHLFTQAENPSLPEMQATIAQMKANFGLLLEMSDADDQEQELQALVDQMVADEA